MGWEPLNCSAVWQWPPYLWPLQAEATGLPLQVWGASPGQESCRCGANAQGEDGGGEEEEGRAGEEEEQGGGGARRKEGQNESVTL